MSLRAIFKINILNSGMILRLIVSSSCTVEKQPYLHIHLNNFQSETYFRPEMTRWSNSASPADERNLQFQGQGTTKQHNLCQPFSSWIPMKFHYMQPFHNSCMKEWICYGKLMWNIAFQCKNQVEEWLNITLWCE